MISQLDWIPLNMNGIHSWNHTMRQTPVARNYCLAAIPRMKRLKYTTRQVILGTAARRSFLATGV